MAEETHIHYPGETEACRQFDAELQAHLEREDRPGVIVHARECAFCGVVLADLEQIRSQTRLLPLDEPPVKLWANVRAALAAEDIFQEPVSGWRGWFPNPVRLRQLAPLGALASLVVLSLSLLVPPGSFERREVAERLAAREKPALISPMRAGEDAELARTVGDMESNYRARERSFEPSVQAAYQKSLESLNGSIRECLDSLRRQPANTLAREYLLIAYERKAEVLASALEFDAR